jgi:hypothetical protein
MIASAIRLRRSQREADRAADFGRRDYYWCWELQVPCLPSERKSAE